MYSATYFGRPHAHPQELNNCGRSLWFYRWSVVITVLLVVVGPADLAIGYKKIFIERASVQSVARVSRSYLTVFL
jgi:hypothetical protein